MRILVAHNAYQQRGGEDAVVEAEIALLRAYGHEVEYFGLHNDALKQMSRTAAAVTAIWSQRSANAVDKLCNAFAPHLIHVHNTFPLISPSLYWTAARHKVPVVQTLHNFRLLCPQAIFLRDGKVCEECVGKLPWRAVAYKCYRESALQSAVAAGMLVAHRAIGSYRERVTRYIALNQFARDKYVEGGLPPERLRIKPNFVVSPGQPDWEDRSGGLYVGRLSNEKGLDVLCSAIRAAVPGKIEVVGDGPLAPLARATFGAGYLGYLPLPEIMDRMARARFLILPSVCYENSPRTIVEAFACGLPVIASRLGALSNIVNDGVTGLLFKPGDAQDLAATISWAQAHPAEMTLMGRAARAEYEREYTPQRNYKLLVDIYDDAITSLQQQLCRA
jgi:glycosyltransferase involved in cell wall biosynthesis